MGTTEEVHDDQAANTNTINVGCCMCKAKHKVGNNSEWVMASAVEYDACKSHGYCVECLAEARRRIKDYAN